MCSSCYVARMRPHRGACLPIDTAQLASLAGRSQMRSDLPFGSLATASRDVSLPLIAAQFNLHRLSRALTYGTLATAPRRPPALHVAAPLSPYRLSRAVRILLTRLARDRTAARQPSVPCRAVSPRGLQLARLSCYVARLRPHRGVNLPLIAAQLSPRGLGRALVLQCDTLVRTGCAAVRSPRYVARLRPHRGVNLCPHCRAAQPSRARPCAHLTMWQACATAPRRQPASHSLAAQPAQIKRCARRLLFGSLATASRCQPALHCRTTQPLRGLGRVRSY